MKYILLVVELAGMSANHSSIVIVSVFIASSLNPYFRELLTSTVPSSYKRYEKINADRGAMDKSRSPTAWSPGVCTGLVTKETSKA
jgi:hypothetical protein